MEENKENLYNVVLKNRGNDEIKKEYESSKKFMNSLEISKIKKRLKAYENFIRIELYNVLKQFVNKYPDLNYAMIDEIVTIDKYTTPECSECQEFLCEWLERHNLGTVDKKHSSIQFCHIKWNKKVLVRDVLDAYYMDLQEVEYYDRPAEEMQEEYESIMQEENNCCADLLTPYFLKYIERYIPIKKFIPLKIYLYIQYHLKKIEYDISKFDTRTSDDYNDYYENPRWYEEHPDESFKNFLLSCAHFSPVLVNELLKKEGLTRTLNKN